MFGTPKQQKPSNWIVEFKDWDCANPMQSLNDLFGSSIALVNAQINWYRWRSKWLKNASKTCRLLGIIFGAVGTLIPLIQVAYSNAVQASGGGAMQSALAAKLSWLGQWGYVAFGLAAVALFWDRIFGFSSSWVRFIKTQLALEEARTELNYDWQLLMVRYANATRLGNDMLAMQMVRRLRDFAREVHTEVRHETEAWVTEFQSNLAELEKFSKAQAEERRPGKQEMEDRVKELQSSPAELEKSSKTQAEKRRLGKLQVTVMNANHFQPGIKVWLDQTESKDIEGTDCLFVNVPPGEHLIRVVGKEQDGTERTASNLIEIAENELTTLRIPLPT